MSCLILNSKVEVVDSVCMEAIRNATNEGMSCVTGRIDQPLKSIPNDVVCQRLELSYTKMDST